MPEPLPRLRMNLDFMPSPVPDRPGLLIRDPYHYSDATLIIPPVLVECLQFFDGKQTELDLRHALVELTGDLQVGELSRHLLDTLSEAGFCEDGNYAQLRERQQTIFAQAEFRAPAHAGSGYPADAEEMRRTFDDYLRAADGAQPRTGLTGIAAPHVSPDGGFGCYASAYRALGPEYRDRVFMVLGTSHYGEADRFGLTRKGFLTPLGAARTETALVDELVAAGGPAVRLEDYAHAVEHSIEFQVAFLQHVYGPDIRIVPVLCGPFLECCRTGGVPESHEKIAQFFDALGKLAAREGDKLFWVLGIDMSHMGRRYGDEFPARADTGGMIDVAQRDRERIGCLEAGDAAGFWKMTEGVADPLKWCGTTPLYTFLKAVPGVHGKLLRYQQWNIDENSVVSFGALAFEKTPA